MDADAWDERYAATELVWSATPNQFVERALADLSPGRALDLACGEGRNARWLAEQGWQVTAMDFSPVAVDKGRQVAPTVDWQVGDVLSSPLPEELDLVVVAYLQLPADERRTAMRRALESLRPGGTLFVVAHDSTNLTEGTGGPTEAEVLYTAEDVLADLADLEPGVVRAGRVAREVAATPGAGAPTHQHAATATAWDALVHLTRS